MAIAPTEGGTTMNAVQTSDTKPFPVPLPYSTKRHGLTLDNCDAEPVKTPGCIQAHGAMLVLRLSDLRILQASENAGSLLGHPAEKLLGRNVATVIGVPGESQLREQLHKLQTDCNPTYVLTLPSQNVEANGLKVSELDVTVHTVDGVAVLEFESTGRSDAINTDYYAHIKKAVARLQAANSLKHFCDAVTDEIRELTGLDRVMIYQFHADGHGEVFAESKRADLGAWLGLHYPAADIPKPARDIFAKTWIRPVPDISGALAELVPLVNPDTGSPLDMTYCALRGTSIMYTEYLRNMDVAAALTMAVRSSEGLWGLIACHHYAGPTHFTYQMRAACEFLAQVVSLQHQAAEDREHRLYRLKLESVHRELLASAGREGGLACLTQGHPSLLEGIEAGGAALYYLDRWWRVGNSPTEADLDELAKWLFDGRLTSGPRPLYATHCLSREYPPAAKFAGVASGLLAFPISPSERSLIVWFRPETVHTVNWAGNPHDAPSVQGPHGPRLTPRRSFELFAESVHQQSMPWKTVEIEAAAALRLPVMELVRNRAERRVDLNADLARSNEELDAFAYVASHDLKEPLRGIYQYANQLLEDEELLGEGNREKLGRLMRLTSRMDSLLDSLLHFARVGRAELSLEAVDLNLLLAEAVEIVGFRTTDGQSEVVVPRLLPTVLCNRVRCRQVFVNLLSNALKYTDKALKRIEVGYIDVADEHARPNCPRGAENHTIYYVADNGIGILGNHFEPIFKLFRRLHGQEEYGGGTGAGLTIVRKLVEQHGGKVWVASLPGEGSTFYFTLPAATETS
jgi:chemotaxis family two-component system sensor kinase Cph1